MDGTLVLTRDHPLAAPSKNHRYSTSMQNAVDADTCLVIATGIPSPTKRNDSTVYRDSGHRSGTDGPTGHGRSGGPRRPRRR